MTVLTEVVTPAGAPKPLRRRARRLRRTSPLTYLLLAVIVALSSGPLYFMVVMASRPNSDIASPTPPLTLGGELGTNVQRVLDNTDVAFTKALVNSLLVASTATVSVVVLCSMAGFAFAKLRFRGRNALLLVVIGTMMVPVQLGLIPLYMLMGRMHLLGTLPAVTLPFLVTGFGVFLMRQYAIVAVPDELIEAARIDGASTIRIFASIVMPALRPAAAVLGLFTFMERWNDFLWPYLALNDPDTSTVQVALSRLSGGYYDDQALIMAGTLLATLPLVVVFVLFGRQIIGGIMEGGVKA